MAATHQHLIPLADVLRAMRYNEHTVEDRVRELEHELKARGTKLSYDWADRPCVTEQEAAKLLAELRTPVEFKEPAEGLMAVPSMFRRIFPGSGSDTSWAGGR
jgi:hypothetical protein